MDLWIRSQNGNVLMPVKSKLELFYDAPEHILIISNDTILGAYKSRDRVLEVLDEIQSLIDFMVCKEIFTYDSEQFMQLTYKQIQHIKENGCIYEMPKE